MRFALPEIIVGEGIQWGAFQKIVVAGVESNQCEDYKDVFSNTK